MSTKDKLTLLSLLTNSVTSGHVIIDMGFGRKPIKVERNRCAKCGDAIPHGRAGRKCKKCR